MKRSVPSLSGSSTHMSDEPQYSNSFFEQHAAGSLASARTILPILFRYYQPRTVVDVGCGLGTWLKVAKELGAVDVLGIDGDYVDRKALFISEAEFLSADLRQEIAVARTFDLAISVEVAEHLPYERAATFVADLAGLSDVVLFSAALPYQGGTDHVNEQWLEFWAILFQRHGFVPCDFLRNECWGNPAVEFWYSQNAIVFCKEELATRIFPTEFLAADRPISRVHPLTLLTNAARSRPLAFAVLELECEDYRSLIRAYQNATGKLPPLRVMEAKDTQNAALFPAARMVLLSDVRAEIARRDAEVVSLAAEVAKKSQELARREAEIAGLAKEVGSLRNSLSWRLTGPMRRCAGWFSGLIANKS